MPASSSGRAPLAIGARQRHQEGAIQLNVVGAGLLQAREEPRHAVVGDGEKGVRLLRQRQSGEVVVREIAQPADQAQAHAPRGQLRARFGALGVADVVAAAVRQQKAGHGTRSAPTSRRRTAHPAQTDDRADDHDHAEHAAHQKPDQRQRRQRPIHRIARRRCLWGQLSHERSPEENARGMPRDCLVLITRRR